MRKSYIMSFDANGVTFVDSTFQATIEGSVSNNDLHEHYLNNHCQPYVADKIRESGKKIVFTEIEGYC